MTKDEQKERLEKIIREIKEKNKENKDMLTKYKECIDSCAYEYEELYPQFEREDCGELIHKTEEIDSLLNEIYFILA